MGMNPFRNGSPAKSDGAHALALSGDEMWECAAEVVDALVESGMGLGEVLRDYATQTAMQMRACENLWRQRNLYRGNPEAEIKLAAVISSVQMVLDSTPAAMLRNRATMLGDKNKISREEVMELAEVFRRNPDTQHYLPYKASEMLV